MDKKDETIAALTHALQFYADPGTYHAMSFVFDPPCGGFQEDFSEDHGDAVYDRPMPGSLARDTLKAIANGDLSVLKCDVHETPLRVSPVLYCQECTDES